MSTWPRVSMGRPFLEKFADVQWEVDEDHLNAWKEGRTGFPIVDAAMRASKKRGESTACGPKLLTRLRLDGEQS
jgi:deoxyribodipyrimidine photo-lyase